VRAQKKLLCKLTSVMVRKPLPMSQVNGRVLPDAALEYGNSSGVLAQNQGQWRPSGHTPLVNPARLKSWAIINLASQRCSNRGVADFVSHLSTEMKARGMQAQQPATILDGSKYSGNVGAAFDAIVERAGSAQTQLVLVVLPAKGSALYSQVKEAAAQRGIVTQCVVAPKARIQGDTANRDVPYLNNLLLKINVKLVRLGSQACSASATSIILYDGIRTALHH
jgi:hypothetical protein